MSACRIPCSNIDVIVQVSRNYHGITDRGITFLINGQCLNLSDIIHDDVDKQKFKKLHVGLGLDV